MEAVGNLAYLNRLAAGLLAGGAAVLLMCIPLIAEGNLPSPSIPPVGTVSPTPEPTEPDQEAAPMHAALGASTDGQLRVLAAYEERLGRGFHQMMLFRDMPTSQTEARQQAVEFAPVLKEYAKQGIAPLVIFEPQTVDLRDVRADVFAVYMSTLKAQGLTDKQVGTWVPFPEPNIPEWGVGADKGNTSPQLFVKNVTTFARELKGQFPGAKLGVLLDSASYPSGDVDYNHPSYDPDDLVTYVTGFPPATVDTVGLQGFPWAPRANDPGVPSNLDAGKFLKASLLVAVAKKLQVTNVWLNTGTFSSMYDWEPGWRTAMSLSQRERLLSDILVQIEKVQQAGLQVSVTLFAEDKREIEADWSYAQDAASWQALTHFVRTATGKGVSVSIFDKP